MSDSDKAKRDAKNARRRELRALKKAATPSWYRSAPPRQAEVEAKAPTKKARTVAIYSEVMKAKGARKDGIARLTDELGLSLAGASTYWQNCKSGVWS